MEFVGKIINLCKSNQDLETYLYPVIDAYMTENQEGKIEFPGSKDD